MFCAENVKFMGLLASVCYFTLATECRFEELDDDLDDMKIADKYKKLNHNNQIKKSKVQCGNSVDSAFKGD